MPERIGVVSAEPRSPDGRRFLTTPDGLQLVDADASHAELADRYGLDRVVTMPRLPDCVSGVCIDGPLTGTTVSYVLNEQGRRGRYSSGRAGSTDGLVMYEVARTADGDRPAELRHVPDKAV